MALRDAARAPSFPCFWPHAFGESFLTGFGYRSTPSASVAVSSSRFGISAALAAASI
jgi:hypothetical protein